MLNAFSVIVYVPITVDITSFCVCSNMNIKKYFNGKAMP